MGKTMIPEATIVFRYGSFRLVSGWERLRRPVIVFDDCSDGASPGNSGDMAISAAATYLTAEEPRMKVSLPARA